jgi:hypothetical protein
MRDDARLGAIQSIERAFGGVALGSVMGLHESRVMDDLCGRASKEDRDIARLSDELHDWRRISDENIESNPYGLLYMDGEGLRFHLPVYMSYFLRRYKDVQNWSVGAAGRRLCDPDCADRLRNYLTDQQTNAIIEFLNVYLVLGDEGYLDTDDVHLAIRMWRGDSEAANQLRADSVADSEMARQLAWSHIGCTPDEIRDLVRAGLECTSTDSGEEHKSRIKLLSRKRAAGLTKTWHALKLIFPMVLFGVLLYRLLTSQNGQWWWFNLAAVVCIILAACLILCSEFNGGNSDHV